MAIKDDSINLTMAALATRFGVLENCEPLDNDTLRQMAARGSCRDYDQRPVAPSLVRTLCAVALSSPSKSDLQQRDIIIVGDKAQRTKVNALFDPDNWINNAPALLIFCANNRRQRQLAEWRQQPFANDHLDAFFNPSVDAGIALSAFVIAAESVGLGCCPISVIRNHASQISDIFELPDYVFPVAGMGLGWPRQKPDISMRLPLAATLHADRFSEQHIQSQVESYDAERLARRIESDQDNQPAWSELKARQYASPQRVDFGVFIRTKKFKLD